MTISHDERLPLEYDPHRQAVPVFVYTPTDHGIYEGYQVGYKIFYGPHIQKQDSTSCYLTRADAETARENAIIREIRGVTSRLGHLHRVREEFGIEADFSIEEAAIPISNKKRVIAFALFHFVMLIVLSSCCLFVESTMVKLIISVAAFQNAILMNLFVRRLRRKLSWL